MRDMVQAPMAIVSGYASLASAMFGLVGKKKAYMHGRLTVGM